MGNNLSKIRVGETNTNKLGQKMTLIAYRSCEDVDIQFEDGTVLKHKKYYIFKSGKMLNYASRLNEEKLNTYGLKMKIVKYTSSEDIDVQFEDGTIVKSRYKHFTSGSIKNPNWHIGEKYKLRDGTEAEIVAYRGFYDVDVVLSTGEKVTNISYRTLTNGGLGRNPKFEK